MLLDDPDRLGALALVLLYASIMSGHLHSIDGLLMWRQARALSFHHTILFDPPIPWDQFVFHTSNYGIGMSLLYVPGLLIWSWLNPTSAQLDALPPGLLALYGDDLYAALGAPLHIVVTAAAAYLTARLIRQLGFGTGTALLGMALYGTASPALVYSRGDWAQPLEGLCWLAAITAALSTRNSYSTMAAITCSVAASFAVLTRTLEGLLVLPAVLLVLSTDSSCRPFTNAKLLTRAFLLPIALVLTGFAVGIVLTLLVNALRYGDVLETGYGPVFTLWTTPLVLGLAGALVSPARGIVWAMPAALLAPAGFYALWRKRFTIVALALVVPCVLLLLETATWSMWWGGVNWGLRLFVPALPMLAILSAIGAYHLRSKVPPWLIPALFAAGVSWALPGILTDALGGYGGFADGSDASFRWQTYPLIGAWQYLKHPLATTTLDTVSIDIIWFRLAHQTDYVSLIPMAGFLLGAMFCARRTWVIAQALLASG